MRNAAVALLAAVAAAGCTSTTGASADAAVSDAFGAPTPVRIAGYVGSVMEPFLSRDGRLLLFNNLNDPAVNTELHAAEFVDDTTFRYLGPVAGANSPALEGVPSLDTAGTLYFVSTRSYDTTLSTLYRARYAGGTATAPELVPGVSRREAGIVNFDAEVSPDGGTLYFVDARFGAAGPETADLVVATRSGAGFRRVAPAASPFGAVNSAALEYAPAVTADGRTLVFTRAGDGVVGGAALFIATRPNASAAFGAPARLAELTGFVEGATFTPDGGGIYYHRRTGNGFALFLARAQ